MTQAPPAPLAAADDARLVETWVARSASRHTRRKYRAQAARFLAFLGTPLREATLADIQAYLLTLKDKASATQANAAAALKSLFSFAQETGALPVNVGKAVKAPPVKNTLAERILAEADTTRMIALEPDARNRALLTVLYGAGLRISEAIGLRWRDLAPRDRAGQATVYGKGGKTRIVLLSPGTWRLLSAQQDAPEPDGWLLIHLPDRPHVREMTAGADQRPFEVIAEPEGTGTARVSLSGAGCSARAAIRATGSVTEKPMLSRKAHFGPPSECVWPSKDLRTLACNRGRFPGDGVLRFGSGVIQRRAWCCRMLIGWMLSR